ncbi:hypothetical protein D3C71_1937070 [compost metagenome]
MLNPERLNHRTFQYAPDGFLHAIAPIRLEFFQLHACAKLRPYAEQFVPKAKHSYQIKHALVAQTFRTQRHHDVGKFQSAVFVLIAIVLHVQNHG